MTHGLRATILPESQRRTLEELTAELDLHEGDRRAKRSAFWTMLTLSAVIASAGVLADSTATVIGAMIIAPLSTPIMGIALAIVKRERNGSVLLVVLGALLVILIGAAFSRTLPGSYDLLDNSQVSSRVSPGLVDLIGALATGLAGAVALARRDVAAVLPGVAIAISLVPPLAVVGVCLEHGHFVLAGGAGMLFLSNLVALVLAGVFVFTVLGYSSEDAPPSRTPRRTYVTLGILSAVVVVALGLNSALSYYVSDLEARVRVATTQWLDQVQDSEVTGVDLHSLTFRVAVRAPGELPDPQLLMGSLRHEIPDGFKIEIDTTVGRRIDAGTVGD